MRFKRIKSKQQYTLNYFFQFDKPWNKLVNLLTAVVSSALCLGDYVLPLHYTCVKVTFLWIYLRLIRPQRKKGKSKWCLLLVTLITLRVFFFCTTEIYVCVHICLATLTYVLPLNLWLCFLFYGKIRESKIDNVLMTLITINSPWDNTFPKKYFLRHTKAFMVVLKADGLRLMMIWFQYFMECEGISLIEITGCHLIYMLTNNIVPKDLVKVSMLVWTKQDNFCLVLLQIFTISHKLYSLLLKPRKIDHIFKKFSKERSLMIKT
jgi:hypothetical protein